MSNSLLIHLAYPLDKPKLLAEALHAQKSAEPFNVVRGGQSSRQPQYQFKTKDWSSTYTDQIKKDLGINGVTKFYYQDADYSLDFHTDIKTLCSVNMLLSDHTAPISFFDDNIYVEHVYEQALVDVSKNHAVFNKGFPRILFKISIFNKTFEEVAETINYRRL